MAVRTFAAKGGAEKFSLRLAEYLRDQGHNVRVLAIQGQSLDGVQVIPVSSPRLGLRASRDWSASRALAKALAGEQADLTWGEQKTWGAMMLRPGGGVEKEYWNVRANYRKPGSLQHPAARKVGIKRCFDLRSERNGYEHPNLRMVVVNSHMVKEQCLRHYPRLEGRIEVVHNGSEPPRPSGASGTELIGSLNLGTDRKVALFLGHDFARKGLSESIRGLAIALKRNPDLPLQLLVAGRGHFHPYRRLASSLGIADRVSYAGCTTSPDLLFQASDLLVLPSHYDAFANVTVEALRAGLPVLTSLTNGAHEVLNCGKDSWLISDPTDHEEIATSFTAAGDATILAARQREALQTGQRLLLQDQLHRIEHMMLDVASRSESRCIGT